MIHNEIGICDDRCRECYYRGTRSKIETPFCQYIIITGHMRPCPAGENCTKFISVKKGE